MSAETLNEYNEILEGGLKEPIDTTHDDNLDIELKYDFCGNKYMCLPEITPVMFKEDNSTKYIIDIGKMYKEGHGVLNSTVQKYNSILNRAVTIKNYSSPIYQKHYRQTMLRGYIPYDNVINGNYDYIDTAYEVEHYIPNDNSNLKKFYYFDRFNSEDLTDHTINEHGFVEVKGQTIMCQHELMLQRKIPIATIIRTCVSAKHNRCKYCGTSFENLLSDDYIFNDEATALIKDFISESGITSLRIWSKIINTMETIDKDFPTKTDKYISGLLSVVLYSLLTTGLKHERFVISDHNCLKLTRRYDYYFEANGWNQSDVNLLMRKVDALTMLDELKSEQTIIGTPTYERENLKNLLNTEIKNEIEKDELIKFNDVILNDDVKMKIEKILQTPERSTLDDSKQVVCNNFYHDFKDDVCVHCGLKRDYSNKDEILNKLKELKQKGSDHPDIVVFERLEKEELELLSNEDAETMFRYITEETNEKNYHMFMDLKKIFWKYLVKINEKYEVKLNLDEIKKLFDNETLKEFPYQLYKDILSVVFSKTCFFDDFASELSTSYVF